MYKIFGLNINDPNDRNAWYLIAEIFWAAVLYATTTFNAVYAVRLGASNLAVGLLTSLPALLVVLVSIPFGRFLAARQVRKPWILGSLVLYRANSFFIALVPWLSLAGISQGAQVVLIIVTLSIPVVFFNVGFTPMLADVIPEDKRAMVLSYRYMIFYATVSVLTLVYGAWLWRVQFPINYQVMYIFGWLASMFSLYNLIKVRVPDSIPTPKETLDERIPFWTRLQNLRNTPQFTRFTVNTFLHGVGIWGATPLLTLYFVRGLGASDAWIGLQGMILSAFTILGYWLGRRAIGRWGELFSLKYVIVTLGIYPLLVGFLTDLTSILFVVVFYGIVSAAMNLCHLNTQIMVTPEDRRPEFTAIFMAITNIGQFIAPLVSVALADWLGMAPVLVGCGLLSIIGSFSFWIWPVQTERQNFN